VNSFRRFIKKIKKNKKKNATRVECKDILIDFLRRIDQKKKREVSLVLIDRLFFFSLLEYFDDLIYLYDFDY
jgi:hypothetical protein